MHQTLWTCLLSLDWGSGQGCPSSSLETFHKDLTVDSVFLTLDTLMLGNTGTLFSGLSLGLEVGAGFWSLSQLCVFSGLLATA